MSEVYGWGERSPRPQGENHFLTDDPENSLLIMRKLHSKTAWQFMSSCQKQKAGLAEPSFSGTNGGSVNGI